MNQQQFARALFPRTTNQHGCVTLHSYHFYVEEGLPKTQILLWVYGEQLRAVFDNVVLAEYHCRYDGQDRHVKEIRDGVFFATQFASPQGALIPLNAQESLVLYRPKAHRRQAPLPFPTQQLWLFEFMRTAQRSTIRNTVDLFPHWCTGCFGEVCAVCHHQPPTPSPEHPRRGGSRSVLSQGH